MADNATDDRFDDSPSTLVAIARAAHLCGDRELLRVTRRELLARFGIVVRFVPLAQYEGGAR